MAAISRFLGYSHVDPVISSGYDKKNHEQDLPDDEENSVVTQQIPSLLKGAEGFENIIGVSVVSKRGTRDINSDPRTPGEVQQLLNSFDPMRGIEFINQGQKKAMEEMSSGSSWVTSLSAATGLYFGGPLGALGATIGAYALRCLRAQRSAEKEIIDLTTPQIIERLKDLALQLECNGIIPVTKMQADENLENLRIQGNCPKGVVEAHKSYTELLQKQPLRIT